MFVINDVNLVFFIYDNLMDLVYDYNWFNYDNLVYIEGVGFDIFYFSYLLCFMSWVYKEFEYFLFCWCVDFKCSIEYVGGIFVKDNWIICIIYLLGFG